MPKDCNKPLTKEETQITNKGVRRCCPQAPSGMQMKRQRRITAHPLQWPKPQTRTTLRAGEDVEQPRSFLVGMQSGPATLGDSLVVSYKTNVILYNVAIMLLGIFPKEQQRCVPTKTRHTDVYSGFIHNCPIKGAATVPFGR